LTTPEPVLHGSTDARVKPKIAPAQSLGGDNHEVELILVEIQNAALTSDCRKPGVLPRHDPLFTNSEINVFTSTVTNFLFEVSGPPPVPDAPEAMPARASRPPCPNSEDVAAAG